MDNRNERLQKYFEYSLSTFDKQETRDTARKWFTKFPTYYTFVFASVRFWSRVLLVALFCYFLNVSMGSLLIFTVLVLALVLGGGIHMAYLIIQDEKNKEI